MRVWAANNKLQLALIDFFRERESEAEKLTIQSSWFILLYISWFLNYGLQMARKKFEKIWLKAEGEDK